MAYIAMLTLLKFRLMVKPTAVLKSCHLGQGLMQAKKNRPEGRFFVQLAN